jgi:hypothetical protein
MLVNHSPFRIRVHPYLGIVQLCLITLTSQPNRTYGTQVLGSKYIDDDGGPSKFWLDYSIRALRQNLNLKFTDEKTERLLEEYSKELDEPRRGRLAQLVKRHEIIHDFEDFAEVFVNAESKRGARSLLLTGTSKNIPLWRDDRRSRPRRGGSFNPWRLTEAAGSRHRFLWRWLDRLNSRNPTRGAPVHPAAAAILSRQTKRRML